MNDPLFLIFVGVVVLFFILLALKKITSLKICVLCFSIALTWLSLLVMLRLKFFDNSLLIALMIGNSIVGVYYLLENKIAEKFHIFRLPFFLTLIFLGYFLVSATQIKELILTIALLCILWLFFLILYLFGQNFMHKMAFPRLKSLISEIIKCCKNW